MEKYFNKFPNIYYRDKLCKDLTRRVRLTPDVKDNIELYYPVEVQAGFRADALSEAYYDDAELEWLIYLTNNIVDPYYQWYFSEINFNDFITKKYGSIATAQEKIKFYRNNWYNDDAELPVSVYNNTIDSSWKKYYEPVFGTGTNILYYTRKKEDWTVNTNKIIQYTISSNISFVNNEIVDIKYLGEIVGGGTVVASNSSVLILHHVSGNTSANTTATKTIVGETSSANGTANAAIVLQENFTNAEAVFWESVSYYDWELENYESKKTVNVIDSSLVMDITEEIRQKLKE